jgi:hypothetical protein
VRLKAMSSTDCPSIEQLPGANGGTSDDRLVTSQKIIVIQQE